MSVYGYSMVRQTVFELKICVFLQFAVCKQFYLISDMKVLEKIVCSIEANGLLWGVSKLVPLVYGIRKLQINCVIEDDKSQEISWERKSQNLKITFSQRTLLPLTRSNVITLVFRQYLT